MTRLFIAIAIPPVIKEGLAGMGRSIPGARPVAADQMHLTLRFIGEVEGSRLLDIQETLTEIAHPQFFLRLQGVGVFPPRGTPRVLWAGIQPTDKLLTLRRAIDQNLAAIDIPREKQKFSPHLTLARLTEPPLHRLQQFLAGNALLRSPEFVVTNFILYKSQLTPRGAIHTLLASYALTLPPAEDF